jgi:hypothetical protein
LYLNSTPRCELRDDHRVSNLPENSRVGLSAQPVVERMEIGCRDDELEVGRLVKG